eukprot:scaffold5679_cov410-Prasinococcus_capsulatus_cf.AAC.3
MKRPPWKVPCTDWRSVSSPGAPQSAESNMDIAQVVVRIEETVEPEPVGGFGGRPVNVQWVQVAVVVVVREVVWPRRIADEIPRGMHRSAQSTNARQRARAQKPTGCSLREEDAPVHVVGTHVRVVTSHTDVEELS